MRNPAYSKKKKTRIDVEVMIQGIRSGKQDVLSKAITLVESHLSEHRQIAEKLLKALESKKVNSLRIGVSGSPGVGKSTMIESFGAELVSQNHKVAVLAIDPSSHQSGGSLLGDKTRMSKLSRMKEVFIRPTSARKTLGGVARHTREVITICEAAGYDRIIIETVGVGQSETHVKYLSDLFLLLVLPGAGDELQGIKRGIVELADLVLINKADDDRIQLAKNSKRHYRNALMLLGNRSRLFSPEVMLISGLKGTGIKELIDKISQLKSEHLKDDILLKKRSEQDLFWFREYFDESLEERFMSDEKKKSAFHKIISSLENGEYSLSEAMDSLKKLINR